MQSIAPASKRCLSVVAVSILMLAGSCNRHRGQTIAPQQLSGAETIVRQWKVIGPFSFESSRGNAAYPLSKAGLNHDYLGALGYPEAAFDASLPQVENKLSQFTTSYLTDIATVPFDHIYRGVENAVAYAYAELDSPLSMDLAIEAGSADGLQLWLNHELICDTGDHVVRAAFKNTHIIPVHIKKGRNILLAKVDHKTDSWALIVSFIGMTTAHEIELEGIDGDLVDNRFVTTPSLHLKRPLIAQRIPVQIDVVDCRGRSVQTATLPSGSGSTLFLSNLSPGYYDVSMRVGRVTVRDGFYIGTQTDIRKSLERSRTSHGRSNLAIDAMIRRFNVLTSPSYYKPADRNWQKKLLMVAHQSVMMSNCEQQVAGCVPGGFQLEEYISAIDDQPQGYLLYRPPGLKGRAPLVIVMPYAQNPERPFFESSLISWPDDLTQLARAADQSGTAVVIANGRGTVGDAPVGEADIFEMLRSLKGLLQTDPNRLYLYGVCEGGRRALLLAEHYPTLFAGVGVYGPALNAYEGDRNSKHWFEHNGVVALASNLSNIPVLLVRGDLDDQASPRLSSQLVDTINRNHGNARTIVIHGGMHKERDLERLIFPLLASQRRRVFPGEIHFLTSTLSYSCAYWLKVRSGTAVDNKPMKVDAKIDAMGDVAITTAGISVLQVNLSPNWPGIKAGARVIWNDKMIGVINRRRWMSFCRDNCARSRRPGPLVAEVFAHRFLVVIGSSREDDAVASMSVVTHWTQAFYKSCRTVPDYKLTSRLAIHQNLVFVGRMRASTYAANLLSSQLLSRKVNGASVGQTLVPSNGDVAIAAFYNPTGPNAISVVIQGSASKWRRWDGNLILGGRYQAAK